MTKAACICILFFALRCPAQTAYFIDGYHGGIYGHLPTWQTKFMVEQLAQHPDWKINLEIEPESWDTIARQDPASYAAFQRLLADQSSNGRIEYVNPAYGQAYMYNISGESIIRQFYYGMKKLRGHFPSLVFSTYSSEEPCFTSALPQILRSYGFTYASLKNPNTCWGGYSRAFGGELVNWIGPDGSHILAVPRYGIEVLKPRSIWETIASANSREYVGNALRYGIRHPVGMCLQDAGWVFGPWLREANVDHGARSAGVADSQKVYVPSVYATWRGYMENITSRKADTDWRFSQEDVLVGLMWGSQVLQRIAREVRSSENRVVSAEKMAAFARVWGGSPWPEDALDAGWRTLMLSQHHDCWIVPYNGKPGDTWADKVVRWTGYTNACSDSIIDVSVRKMSEVVKMSEIGKTGEAGKMGEVVKMGEAGEAVSRGTVGKDEGVRWVRVFNTSSVKRNEYVRLPASDVLLKVEVPPMGYATYRLEKEKAMEKGGATVRQLANGQYQVETDLYRILLDPAKGGAITSWVAKELGGKEFVEEGKNFNELRGNFYNAGGFRTSTESPAEIVILENGPAAIKLSIKGMIAGSPFTQVLTAVQGQPRVDCHLVIDWNGNPAIGEYFEVPKNDQVRKAYYDDRYKLLALFPVRLASQKVFKNAPFDVTESRLANTFYNRWDSIKNNVLLNWVDVEDSAGKYGMALFCDHTTSYAHGADLPLGLTVQYSGNGIFYRNYTIDGPSEMNYAWMPHAGKWDRAGIWTEGVKWNEPLLVRMMKEGKVGDESLLRPGGTGGLGKTQPGRAGSERSLLQMGRAGMEISSLRFSGDDLLVRVFNAEAAGADQQIFLGFAADSVDEVDLNGSRIKGLPIRKDASGRRFVELSIPRFGIRTLRFGHTRIK